ncbi:hypothetical protein pipiens_018992 [Culex pipiens pipiens]|uniref:Uncharacterized protein n=1 Tax=Culex pipiens pipiens TaxID=38569 RepID=A0ABD1DYQ4_CULPP
MINVAWSPVQQDPIMLAVRSMDYNPYQNELLASGASESEILIWDLNKTTPMSTGTMAQPFEDSVAPGTDLSVARWVVMDRELIERSNRYEQVLAEGTRSDASVRRNLKDCFTKDTTGWETSRLDCAIYSDAGNI